MNGNLTDFIITERLDNAKRELIAAKVKPVIIIGVAAVGPAAVKVVSLDHMTDAEMITLFKAAITALETVTQLELEKALRKKKDG